MINIPHHVMQTKITRAVLTVNSDGDSLGEDEAVSALESRDLAELVELQVLGRNTLAGLSLDDLDVETVLLCDRKERCGTRVTLLDSCQESCSSRE